MSAQSRHNDGEKPKRKQTAAQLANLTGGSRRGVPNKFTATVKEMVIGALDKAGGEQYLLRQAEENPKAFMSLVGRVIPVQNEHSGPDGDAIRLEQIQNDAHAFTSAIIRQFARG